MLVHGTKTDVNRTVLFYVLVVFAVALLPVPGFGWPSWLESEMFEGDRPYLFLTMGFFYFLAMGVCNALIARFIKEPQPAMVD